MIFIYDSWDILDISVKYKNIIFYIISFILIGNYTLCMYNT